MYRFRYINKHFQFGRTNYTLLLEDLEGDMPAVRVEKEFALSPEQIDSDFLYQEARKEILAAQEAYNEMLAAQESEEVPAGEQ